MIVDASVLVAVVLREQGHAQAVERLVAEDGARCGAPTLLEAGIVLRARLGAGGRTLLEAVLDELRIEALPFEERHWRLALDAFTRFGKGRHAASLNLGDCLCYAVAKVAAEPLLCLGGDFALTDLELA